MAKFIVTDGHKQHDGKLYAPGDVMEVSEDIARALRLSPAPEEEGKKPLNAKETIDLIAQMTDAAQVEEYLGDSRSTVVAAAEKRLAELKEA